MARSIQILKDVSQLILSVENSSIEKINKLKLIKVLFVIKLKLIELLEKELKMETRVIYRASVARNINESTKVPGKHDLIIQFIKSKSGPVSPAELLSLGIAGRSLRRYIKNLIDGRKIKIEKSGRNYFYSLT